MNEQSVKDKLKNLGREKNKNYNELLIRYGIERFLYRLSISAYREHFILKGGALLYTIFEFSSRVTKDIDVLAKHINNSTEQICKTITDICQIETDDALRFQPPCLDDVMHISEEDEYHGIRVKFKAFLGRAEIYLLSDI